MKKQLTVAIIAALLIMLATFEAITVSNIINYVDDEVNKIYQEYELNKNDITVLYPKLDEIDEYWASKEWWLCLMFNHKDLSAVTDSLNRLLAYTKNNDYDNAIAEVEVLRGITEKNSCNMGFTLQNIL